MEETCETILDYANRHKKTTLRPEAAAFGTAFQSKNEPILEYAKRLKELYREAYPTGEERHLVNKYNRSVCIAKLRDYTLGNSPDYPTAIRQMYMKHRAHTKEMIGMTQEQKTRFERPTGEELKQALLARYRVFVTDQEITEGLETKRQEDQEEQRPDITKDEENQTRPWTPLPPLENMDPHYPQVRLCPPPNFPYEPEWGPSEASTTSSDKKTRQAKQQIICFYCNERGHYRSHCKNKTANHGKKDYENKRKNTYYKPTSRQRTPKESIKQQVEERTVLIATGDKILKIKITITQA